MKKADPFKFKRVPKLPADSSVFTTRYYLMTDKGNFWASPFKEAWQTWPDEIDFDVKILNVFAVRVDLGVAAKCSIGDDVYLWEGETIGFTFRIPLYSRQLDRSVKGPKGDTCLRRSSGQPGTPIRWIYGPNGRLAVRGLVRNSSSADGKKRGHSVAKLLSQARPNDQTLPVRSDKDEAPDPGS